MDACSNINFTAILGRTNPHPRRFNLVFSTQKTEVNVSERFPPLSPAAVASLAPSVVENFHYYIFAPKAGLQETITFHKFASRTITFSLEIN
jgi:hypothetical protein